MSDYSKKTLRDLGYSEDHIKAIEEMAKKPCEFTILAETTGSEQKH